MFEVQIISILVSLVGTTIGSIFALRELKKSGTREKELASLQNSIIFQRSNLTQDLRRRLNDGSSSYETFETFLTYLESISGFEDKLKGKFYNASKNKFTEILVAQISFFCAILGALTAIWAVINS